MHTIQDWIIFFLGSFHAGFTFFCGICFLGRIILPGKIRREFINIHSAVNLNLAIGAVLTMLALGYELYETYWATSEYEHYSRTDLDFYNIPFFANIAGWIIGLLFFIRKFRSNIIMSLLVLVLINADTVIQWITRLWRDYLPSSWQTEYYNDWLIVLQILLFAIITLLLYMLLVKRKKLPYPSVWIR